MYLDASFLEHSSVANPGRSLCRRRSRSSLSPSVVLDIRRKTATALSGPRPPLSEICFGGRRCGWVPRFNAAKSDESARTNGAGWMITTWSCKSLRCSKLSSYPSSSSSMWSPDTTGPQEGPTDYCRQSLMREGLLPLSLEGCTDAVRVASARVVPSAEQDPGRDTDEIVRQVILRFATKEARVAGAILHALPCAAEVQKMWDAVTLHCAGTHTMTRLNRSTCAASIMSATRCASAYDCAVSAKIASPNSAGQHF